MATALNSDIFLLILKPQKTRESFHELLNASHVCSHWYNILTQDCPELWALFAFVTRKDGRTIPTCLDFNKEMLLRSRGRLLDAGWARDDPIPRSTGRNPLTPIDDVLATQPHSQQLRSWVIKTELGDRKFRDTISPVLASTPVPNLRSLSFKQFPKSNHWLPILYIPDTIFNGGDLPLLTSLHLSDVWLNITKLKIPNLKELGVEYDRACSEVPTFDYKYPCSLNHWLDNVLGDLPHLKHLRLHFKIYRQGYVRLTTPPVISFPHLVQLDLVLWLEDFKRFLERVRIPASCRDVRLVLLVDYPSSDYKSLISTFIRRLVVTTTLSPTAPYQFSISNLEEGRITSTLHLPSPSSSQTEERTVAITIQSRPPRLLLQPNYLLQHFAVLLTCWTPLASNITSLAIPLLTLDDAYILPLRIFLDILSRLGELRVASARDAQRLLGAPVEVDEEGGVRCGEREGLRIVVVDDESGAGYGRVSRHVGGSLDRVMRSRRLANKASARGGRK